MKKVVQNLLPLDCMGDIFSSPFGEFERDTKKGKVVIAYDVCDLNCNSCKFEFNCSAEVELITESVGRVK